MAAESFKQALKAIKRSERHHTYAETKYWLNQYRMLMEQAIAAMEKVEKQEPVAWVNLDQFGNLHESSSQTVPPDTFPVYRQPPAAQPTQQEPVAYLLGTKSRPDLPYHSKGLVFPDQMVGFGISVVQAHQARGSDGQIHEAVPLYTTPPAAQRTWVGLTAKQIASIPINEYTVQTAEKLLKENNT